MRFAAYIFLGGILAGNAVAQDIHRASFQCAEETVIPVKESGAAPDVLALMKAFNDRFPVDLADNLLRRAAAGKLSGEEKDSIKNGFLMTDEDDDGNTALSSFGQSASHAQFCSFHSTLIFYAFLDFVRHCHHSFNCCQPPVLQRARKIRTG